MAGLEFLTGNDRLSILQCAEFAKEIGYDNTTFDLVGPNGKLKCKWVDAYFGMFKVIEPGKEPDGVLIVKEVQFWPNIYCENVMIED